MRGTIIFILVVNQSVLGGNWEGIDLKILSPSGENAVASPIAMAFELNAKTGSGADLIRTSPGEWDVCYESRGMAGSRVCAALNITYMPALRLKSGDHLIDAWIRPRSGPEATRHALVSKFVRVLMNQEISMSTNAVDDCQILIPCEINQVLHIQVESKTFDLLYDLRRYFSTRLLITNIEQLLHQVCASSTLSDCVVKLKIATMRELAARCGCVPWSRQLKLRSWIQEKKNAFIKNPIPFYYINLERRPERDAFMRAQLSGTESLLRLIRFEAIDGGSHTMTTDEMAHFHTSDFLTRAIWSNTVIVRRIMGNLLSHYGVWRALLESTEPVALVFQDDLEIAPDFANRVIGLAHDALAQGAWVVWLAASQGDKMWIGYPLSTHPDAYSDEIFNSGNATIGLCDPDRCQPCSGAYILTRPGALALLDYVETRGFEHQSDILMNKFLLAHNANWIARPLLASTNSSKFESDVWIGPILYYDDV